MNYTYKNVSWKGETTNAAVPTNSRPFHNGDTNLQYVGRTPFKANPIKAWRKSLNPYYKTASSKQVSISQIEAPTTSNSLTTTHEIDCTDETNNLHLLKENVNILSQCNGIYNTSSDGTRRCIGGTNNVRRSASTNVKSNYYTSNSSYLKAKCKTYSSKTTLGSQIEDSTYNSTKCSSNTNTCPIIFKPSNTRFYQQGAVSSSTNILYKKNCAITNNSCSLRTAYGNSNVSLLTTHDSVAGTGYAIRYIKGDNNVTKSSCNTTC